jgi:hypothetical protein
MTAILEFDLDNPDDKMAHLRCVTSLEMALVIFECLHNKADINEMCEKYNINIDKLII